VKSQDIEIVLGAVQETLMIPLWARAMETEKNNPIVFDNYAKDIVDRIDYDFSTFEKGPVAEHQGVWAIRAHNFDNIVKAFIAKHSKTVVVNFGAGLDTSFQRVDDRNVLWINIDLPDVVALRQRLIPDSQREMTIAKSLLDFTWTDDIAQWTKDRSIMFMAAGVLCYLEPEEVEILFRKLSKVYAYSHFVFDTVSWLTAWGQNRAIMKKSGMDSSVLIKWHLKKASELMKWVGAIKVIDEFPMLSRVPPKNDFTRKEMRTIKIVSRFRFYNLIHVQF